MRQRNPYHIAIVGLGVGGATAAILLARQGHRIEIFEQSPHVGPVGAGVLVQPSGQMVLERLGLLDEVSRASARVERLTAVTHRGKRLIDLPYAELADGAHALGTHRGDLFAALYRQVQACGIPVHLGTRIVRRDRAARRLRLRGAMLIDHVNASHGPFDVVIAADGSRSALRDSSGLRHVVYEYPHGAIWATTDASPLPNQLWQATRGMTDLCGLLPVGNNRCSVFWSVRCDDLKSLHARGIDHWRESVVKVCPESEPVVRQLKSFDETRFATYRHVYMPRWHDDTTIFIGDAAHSMSPHLGQGINLAMLDAWTLAHHLGASRSPREAFIATQRDCLSHTRFYAWATAAMSPFFQSRGFVKGLGRDVFLPLMPRVPMLRRQMITTMAGMRAGWMGGRLRLVNT